MNFLIEETLPTGLAVKCSEEYWQKIIKIKHPIMKDKLYDVRLTLKDPDEIRFSNHLPGRLLIYKQFHNGYICVVVVTRENDALVMTTYLTLKIKEGDIIWKK